jgi:hypothetical protein
MAMTQPFHQLKIRRNDFRPDCFEMSDEPNGILFQEVFAEQLSPPLLGHEPEGMPLNLEALPVDRVLNQPEVAAGQPAR